MDGILMSKYLRHIFICVNQRDPSSPRGSCNADGSGDLQKAFKDSVARHGLKSTVRANKSGCLDQCEHGPSVVVYPEAVWYGHVQLSDVEEIMRDHIVGGHTVQRLLLPDDCINNKECGHRDRKPSGGS